jgi:hypothetical protein
MNSAPSGRSDDEDCFDTTLNLSAATLDVYEHERLANTETPLKKSDLESPPTQISALLKTIYYWVLSR